MKDGTAGAEDTTFSTSNALDAFMDSSGEKAAKPEKSEKIEKSKEPKKQGNLLEKIPYKKWQFWAVCGGVVAIIAIVIIIASLSGKKETADGGDKNWIPACSNGATDLISGGEWIVGEDIASGDYLFESNDKYSYAYLYKDKDASSYDRTISLSKGGTFVHIDNGQKIKVSSGNINMTCQEFDNFELVSSSRTMPAGSYTLVAVGDYFYAYIYEKEGDGSYDASASLSKAGEAKDFRFKDGQYLKVSSGSAFLINKNADNYDELLEKVKELASGKTTAKEEKEEKTEEKEEKTEETKPTETPSTPSTPPSTPTQQSSSSSEWKQFLKDYEAWVDKYVAFMKKYKNASASDLAGMMSDYSSLMSEMTTWSNKASKMQSSLSGSDLTEYINTLNRVTTKLNSIY